MIIHVEHYWRFDGSSGCELCDEMSGKYPFKPPRPHPHCNCSISEHDIYKNMVYKETFSEPTGNREPDVFVEYKGEGIYHYTIFGNVHYVETQHWVKYDNLTGTILDEWDEIREWDDYEEICDYYGPAGVCFDEDGSIVIWN